MNVESAAAEQIVRIYLEGFEVTAKLTGSGAKDMAVLLYAIMKDKNKTSGKTKLTNMLKSGKELKVFSIKKEDFKKFTEEAKRYGVLYSALINKKTKNKEDIIDIMVRADDAPKINRIVDKFKMTSYDDTVIRGSIEKNSKILNPNFAMTKNPQSEQLSQNLKTLDQGAKTSNRESVRKKLEKAKIVSENYEKSKVKSKGVKNISNVKKKILKEK